MVIKLKLSCLCLAFMLSSCGGSDRLERHLIIAVASNMHFAMEAIAARFTDKQGIRVEIASASSGVLATQIRQGAPFHIFASANRLYPNTLENEDLTMGTAEVFALGTLILWSLDGTDLSAGIAALDTSTVKNFAIANPEVAPYGIAAAQALDNASYQPGLQDKLVMGESIAQVNQYVSSGAVQVGLTSRSVLYSPNLIDKGHHQDVDRTLYHPIEQSIVTLRKGAEEIPEAAALFYAFVFSAEAQTILSDHGYRPI